MTKEVIMPALGMAQESGVIVSWLKAAGEAVKAGDALMEVETDKAVMEVEAQADGFLTDIRASEGDEVPVGEVIALISDTAEGSGESPPAKAAEPEERNEAPPEPAKKEEPAPPAPQPDTSKAPVPSNGRILASPKARRMAAEQGLDLRRLAESGRPQPYRAADIGHLAGMQSSPTGGPGAATARASLPDAAYQSFLELLVSEGDLAPGAVVAAFAAGALRVACGQTKLTVEVTVPRAGTTTYLDPDLGRISEIAPHEGEAAPDLLVFDLTGSRITEVALSASEAPAVSVARDGDRVVIAMAAQPGQLSDTALVACLDDLAGRFEDPLRHLL